MLINFFAHYPFSHPIAELWETFFPSEKHPSVVYSLYLCENIISFSFFTSMVTECGIVVDTEWVAGFITLKMPHLLTDFFCNWWKSADCLNVDPLWVTFFLWLLLISPHYFLGSMMCLDMDLFLYLPFKVVISWMWVVSFIKNLEGS